MRRSILAITLAFIATVVSACGGAGYSPYQQQYALSPLEVEYTDAYVRAQDLKMNTTRAPDGFYPSECTARYSETLRTNEEGSSLGPAVFGYKSTTTSRLSCSASSLGVEP